MLWHTDVSGRRRAGPIGRWLKGYLIDDALREPGCFEGLAKQAVRFEQRDTTTSGVVTVQDHWCHGPPHPGFRTRVERKHLTLIFQWGECCDPRTLLISEQPPREFDPQQVQGFPICLLR